MSYSNGNHAGTILCLASYFKGTDFLTACKSRGWKVLLVTSLSIKDEAWPRESIDEFFFMPGAKDDWDMHQLIQGMNGVILREKIERIVALDDFDVEKAAHLREHFRIGGMGQTRARYFRDKLAMRVMAKESGMIIPSFIAPFHHDAIHAFTANTPPPWVLKPRSQASATGIKKLHSAEELWKVLDTMGADRVNYVLEHFLPGDVYHVDSLIVHGKVVFARASKYMSPPMAVSHDGGIFRSHTLPEDGEESIALVYWNQQLMDRFGMRNGAAHTEFIRAFADGQYYFLETSSRVGGANLAEMVEAASGINLWAEWAKMETLAVGESYTLPEVRHDQAGIIISLARQQQPDTGAYSDTEIDWRMGKEYHAGLIVKSPDPERIIHLLNQYAERFMHDFHATAPPLDRPSS